ncbi:AAA family ATPase [Uliginosibacterium sp. H3]|uniref:AAA family ATPase n=1 Tax=Uliginosibacterium silvisoli TaxID=3114758 RepID=A0ABU6K419_9RHOO|nr:AAA family ATPase [Uliginosibacterium sp. H3]
MNLFVVSIQSVQNIKSFQLELDLSSNRLICLVGRNGTGKTTLMRALRNLSSADTFQKTANPQIFQENSVIKYTIDGQEILFQYDSDIRSLNCKQEIPRSIRTAISAELPMPYGARFSYFRGASDADSEIRQSLILGRYVKPQELINFLSAIYATDKFDDLVEIAVSGKKFYSIRLEGNRYIREDHLSSGEYFLINLYRTIKGSAKLIAIDEIDLSLDAAAQSRLTAWLRLFCSEYKCSILFTTHSLAIMSTLDRSEISYVEQDADRTIAHPASYSYVRARLFGFQGWDKYILTEDTVLREFIEHVIQNHCPSTFFQYKVIHIGGSFQVTDLLRRNANERFLAAPENVIGILDGDQREVAHAQHDAIHFIPMESVEKAILAHYVENDFPFKLPQHRAFTGPKDVFNAIQQERIATTVEMNKYLCEKYADSIANLSKTLSRFLGAAGST